MSEKELVEYVREFRQHINPVTGVITPYKDLTDEMIFEWGKDSLRASMLNALAAKQAEIDRMNDQLVDRNIVIGAALQERDRALASNADLRATLNRDGDEREGLLGRIDELEKENAALKCCGSCRLFYTDFCPEDNSESDMPIKGKVRYSCDEWEGRTK